MCAQDSVFAAAKIPEQGQMKRKSIFHTRIVSDATLQIYIRFLRMQSPYEVEKTMNKTLFYVPLSVSFSLDEFSCTDTTQLSSKSLFIQLGTGRGVTV
jgi:hypothetical protein